MPTALNVTIGDASPLISYGGPPGAWSQNGSNDSYGGTYTTTFTPGASATLNFEGTWVSVSGSRDPSHGNYTVTLNGYSYVYNGSRPYSGFNTTLFNSVVSTTLPAGSINTLIFENTDEKWHTLDIDSITWTCNLGAHDSESPVQTTMVDDTDHAFGWSGSWDTSPAKLETFNGKTGHSTSQAQASVNFTFSGDAVAIYGTTGPQNSLYSVQRDNQTWEFNATRNMYSSQVLLYFGNNFGPGNNTVSLVNETPGLFQIDYAAVHAVNSSPSSSSSSTSSSTSLPSPTIVVQPASKSPSKLPASAIAAISISALLLVFLFVAVWYLLRRNKTLWMRLQRGYMVQSQFDATSPPNGGVTPLPYSDPAAHAVRTKAAYSRANGDDSSEARPLNRPVTMQSTASTLVADNGSYMTEVARPRSFSLKPLRLASRWASGTPSSVTSHARLSRSPSARHLLREESQYYLEASQLYDPHTVPEGSEDRIDDVLRDPIRRNTRSSHEWQLTLP